MKHKRKRRATEEVGKGGLPSLVLLKGFLITESLIGKSGGELPFLTCSQLTYLFSAEELDQSKRAARFRRLFSVAG